MSDIVMISEKDEYLSTSADNFGIYNDNDNDYSHPVITIIIIIVILLIFYYMYVGFWKTCFTGKWVNSKGVITYIDHNKWNDTIIVNEHINGYTKGDAIYIIKHGYPSMGVMYKDKIYWLYDDVWKKLRV